MLIIRNRWPQKVNMQVDKMIQGCKETKEVKQEVVDVKENSRQPTL